MFEVKPMSVKDETAAGKDESSQCDGGVRMCGDDLLYQYETQDWIISPEEPSAISPMLAEETFRYMTALLAAGSSYPHKGSKVLSADRVEQMTKTYNDIEVVTHLLSERDRDLELAARIGQSLLQRNHVLQERNDSLEEQLAQAVDRIHQLQHELVKKDELFRMVASEESETDSSCSTPLRKVFSTGGSLPLGELNALQMKLQELEDENLSLRSEACQLKKDTSTYEEKEQQLVHDCVQELRESNSQMVSLTNELSQKSEDLLRHQEEIAQLLSQIVQLQHRLKELALEKEELRIHLQASKEAQRQLTAELKELTDRNAECVGMLHESQDEIKELRSKSSPSAGLRRQSYRLHPMDSLAAEIEGTMRKELSVDEERAFQDQRSAQKRVFQTVQCVKQVKAAHTVPPIPGSASNAIIMTPVAFRSHTPNTEDQSEDPSHLGQPGSPGGSDLTSALHRLSLRRQNFLCERQFFQAERDRKLHELEAAESEKAGSGCSSPMGSAVSSFSNLSEFSLSSSYFKTFLPEKLQIVKPMEGSLTLHHWQQLAKPHLASVLDPHPGVVTKGFQPLPQDAIYHLTDLEEDEENAPWVMEKPQNEQKNDEVEDEEEGITFHVRLFSTPVKNESRPMSSLPASLRNSPVSIATTVTVPASNTSLSVTVPATITSTTVTVPATITSTTVASPAVSSAQLHLNLSSSTGVNPGKYQSSTFSTYTFTTCRILHPTDSTQVTPSSACSTTASANTPSSLRTGPSTPVTPCLLSLGDSFPVRRPAAPPGGLAKLVLEKGISAQGSTAATGPKKPVCLRRLPSTPPNSPLHSPCPSPVPFESRSTSTDNFLASRPAELFLQDVYGLKLGRASRLDLLSPEQTSQVESASPDSHSSVTLLQHLRKLGLDKKVLRGSKVNSSNSQEAATFLSTGCGSLLDGLRRNQSLPAMVGRRCVSVSSPSFNLPPPHPTSLALPTPTWAGPVTLPESPPIDRTPSGKY